MSYILEALKKSEQDRQQGDIPDLNSRHILESDLDDLHTDVVWHKRWTLLIVLLFSMVLILAGVVVYLVVVAPKVSSVPAQPIEPRVDTAIESVQAPVSVAPPVSTPVIAREPVQDKPIVSEEKPQPKALQSVDVVVTKPVVMTQEVPKEESKLVVDKSAAERIVVPPVVSQSVASTQAEPVGTDENIPYLTELELSVQQAIPQIVFSTHIYTPKAALRIVGINGKRYTEGAYLFKDILLRQITPTGIILQYNGILFRLDATRNWLKD